eukprot:TRINITY_DN47423_c0_g1_i1.p1 TRINITY_DN47423_c0_g1~~TRINITY_DN47423_c0_g1_i1.p1  ORF type:complete len:276 (-),score=14.69 TRINITY_DN47423_c0_g1_i1:27-803(-)
MDNTFRAYILVPWYLFGTICWRLWSLPLMAVVPWARVVAACAFSLLSGYVVLGDFKAAQEGNFKLNLIVAVFPLYVLGQNIPMRYVRRLEASPLTPTTVAFGIAGLLLVLSLHTSAAGSKFIDKIPYFSWGHYISSFCTAADVRLFFLRGMFKNIFELTKGIMFSACFCPRTKTFCTPAGQKSLYPYLLHMTVVRAWFRMKAPHQAASATWTCEVFLLPFVIVILLASSPVCKAFGWFLQPEWLERAIGAKDMHHHRQ